jgi:FAD/FMN-containing dehydrogenase
VADSPAVQQAAGAFQAQAASYAKAAGGKVAGRAGAARAKVGGAIHDHVPGMRVRESNGRPADGGQGHYAQTPGTAGGPPGG